MPRIHDLNALPAELQEIARTRESASGLLCPACSGGRTGERSLTWKRAGFLGWLRCHRAGCGYHAAVPVDGEYVVAQPAFKPRPYTQPLESPGYALIGFLKRRYGLESTTTTRYVRTPSDVEVFAVPHGQGGMTYVPKAMYMPVLSPYGEDRGGVLRYLDGSKPKTVAYLTTTQPKLAWYIRDTMPGLAPCVVVEDQISAMRCKQLGYNAVALMGTQINDEKAREIRKDRPTLLALDKDAFGKAVGYARRWPWLIPVLLDHDIKDSDDADVKARLEQALPEGRGRAG